MRFFITLTIFIGLQVFNLNATAQLKGKAKEEAINQLTQLKETTTVFFYSKSSGNSIDSIKQAILSAWDLTPLIFEDIRKFQKYASNPKYSYFEIAGHSTSIRSKSFISSNTHYYLVLRLFKEETKRGKIKTDVLCQIDLFPNFQTIEIASSGDDENTVIEELYNKGVFYNWSPILLKAQISNACTNLKNFNRPWPYGGIKSPGLTEILSSDTLYIPEYLLVNFNAFSGKEKKQEENVFANYKFKYKVCSSEELFQIFEIEKRGRLLFEYVKSSTDKFVSIYDVKEKTIVYKKYSPMSYNLTSKDIERIE